MPWPRSERCSPVPKPKAHGLILVPRQNRNEARKWQATPPPLSCPVVSYRKYWCIVKRPGHGHRAGRHCRWTGIYKERTFLFWRGTRMRLRAFGLGTGLPRSDLGQGTWVRVRDLTRYLQGYLYIPRGIYIPYIPRGIYKSPAIFIYPAWYL